MEEENEQWEHHIEYIHADADRQRAFLQELHPGRSFPIYAVQATLPRLNELGEQGWELVQMQPVFVGDNGDILITGGDWKRWTSTYFCVFKRRKR